MRLSRFYHKQKINNEIFAVFNSLTMDVMFLKNDEVLELETYCFSKEKEKLFREYGIIVDEGEDERVLVKYRTAINAYKGRIDNAFIILTNQCNLRCKYCAVKNIAEEERIPVDKEMSYEIIDIFLEKYVRYIKKYNLKKPMIVFYGGEPLICAEKIEYIVKKALGKHDFRFSMVTNGTLINEYIIKVCRENNISMGISIDGPEEINDSNRVFATGESGVYKELLKKFEMLEQEKLKFNLSITITEYLLNHEKEFFMWLLMLCDKYHIDSISYNLLRFQDENVDVAVYNKQATELILKSYEMTRNRIYEDRIARKLKSFMEGIFFYGDCTAISENQIVLKPNGDMVVCQAFCQSQTEIVGNIKECSLEEVEQSELVNKYSRMMTIENEECLNCPALSTCGGGCYWEAERKKETVDKGFCIHSKMVQGWMINDLYEASK